jgi:hypothetical protein
LLKNISAGSGKKYADSCLPSKSSNRLESSLPELAAALKPAAKKLSNQITPPKSRPKTTQPIASQTIICTWWLSSIYESRYFSSLCQRIHPQKKPMAPNTTVGAKAEISASVFTAISRSILLPTSEVSCL